MLDPEALKITAMIVGPALPILLVWVALSSGKDQ